MIGLAAGLLAGATAWTPMPISTPIDPMIFTCESLQTELVVYKNGTADHLRLDIEGRPGTIKFDNAVKAISWTQDEAGKRYRVDYRAGSAPTDATLEVVFVIRSGGNGVSEASFVLTHGKTSISKKCLRAPDGMPGWEKKPEVWL